MTNRIELSITERFLFADGHEFGSVGAYERIIGRAHFAVDPEAPARRGITDLDKAPTDAEGLVHFTGDFSILKLVDPPAATVACSPTTAIAATSGCCSSSTTPRLRTTRAAWRMPAMGF
jgi:hypothetical protein